MQIWTTSLSLPSLQMTYHYLGKHRAIKQVKCMRFCNLFVGNQDNDLIAENQGYGTLPTHR